MNRTREGTTFGVAAYALWGLFPLYWPLLEPTPVIEILAHRVVWSLLLCLVLLRVTRGWQAVRAADATQVRRLALASVLLAANWGVYIYGVDSGQVVETSLGYFVNPLVSVALGVFVLGERLRGVQQAAIGLAVVAVGLLTVANGRPPWIALFLAFSFGTYGLLKKQADVRALPSLAIETAVTAPVGAVFLLVLAVLGRGHFTTSGAAHALLLTTSGVVTVVPLLFFGAAAIRVPLSTMGLLQYLTPTIQLLLGVLLRHEPFGTARAVGFGLVWLALLVLSVDVVRHHRRMVSVATC